MAYRVRCQVSVDWLPPGVGPMNASGAPVVGVAPSGGAQTIAFFNQQGGYAAPTFTASDITNLLALLTTDISAQMNAAATIARIQAFSTGGG